MLLRESTWCWSICELIIKNLTVLCTHSVSWCCVQHVLLIFWHIKCNKIQRYFYASIYIHNFSENRIMQLLWQNISCNCTCANRFLCKLRFKSWIEFAGKFFQLSIFFLNSFFDEVEFKKQLQYLIKILDHYIFLNCSDKKFF